VESHPFLSSATAQLIVDTALQLVGDGPVTDLTVEQVSIEAGTSTSSLYHYFGGRQGLVAAVAQEQYRRLALAEKTSLLDAGSSSQTPEEFLLFIKDQLLRIITDPEAVKVRQQRLRLAAAALDDEEVQNRMSIIQAEMFRVIGEAIADGQRRGLVNPNIDPIAYCAWFHGMALGRTATERNYTDIDAWLAVAVPAALAPLRIPAVDDTDVAI
jgi:AcrR family transcriptional regulator